MKRIILLMTILFFATRITFADQSKNLTLETTKNSKSDSFLQGYSLQTTKKVWQCWSYEVQGCCGLNGTACGYSYDEVIAIIENTIKNFCPNCSCEV